MKHYFSFDVEAMGLFGIPFAVGWVIVDEKGEEKEQGYLAFYPDPAQVVKDMEYEDWLWMQENVIPHLPDTNCENAEEMYRRFWDSWTVALSNYRELVMVSNVPFPVEANFLLKCARFMKLKRADSPYPILDVASVLLKHDGDPLTERERRDNELPAHNPVNDARQSVRLLVEALID